MKQRGTWLAVAGISGFFMLFMFQNMTASSITYDRELKLCVGHHDGQRVIGMHTFGASAPLKELQTKFGFEPNQVVSVAPGGSSSSGRQKGSTELLRSQTRTVLSIDPLTRRCPRSRGGILTVH